MTSRATLGVLAIASVSATCNQGFIIVPPTPGISPEYIYEWLESKKADLERIATGATFKEITKTAFKRFPVLQPPSAILDSFTAVSRPLNQMIGSLEGVNRRLAIARDLLVPRLVCGQLDISDLDLDALAPVEVE
jgi:type I restriction enzyme S subunit